MTVTVDTTPGGPVKSAPTAFREVSRSRRMRNEMARGIFALCFVLGVIPLVWLLWTVISKGAPALGDPNWWFGNAYGIDTTTQFGAGIAQAIVGTLIQALIATVISVPIAVMTGIMLVEYPTSPLVKPVSFMVDILAGVPSIVATLFIFTVFVIGLSMGQSAFMVSLALILLMIPIVVRSTEEMLKLVPDELREASYALGISKWRTIVRVVVPTALSGMLSGIFLAIARIMGETAPVLILAGPASSQVQTNPFEGGMNSLPLFIKDMWAAAQPASDFYYWGAALTLIIIIAVLNLIAAMTAKFLAPKTK
ncbi:phosphate ABC transporter permease PstA [Gordonia sp. HNM0687]|uniref:Phosphate transport system permease protein PstA n=1 Tax=Gordonia mangrovi TaxID=2665643 RepID=A0A6L7GW18_9ACTN|nr:phosphate ABC transporter permease PstA [Gordonia mangrovi]MDY6807594.1 phosphate ABC transporter permease PstA [Actinomycetota bacterium]MXP23231.1 phosphate ABC transporter permease PstA [Gordonia mangrovi]UVF76846.1 phosphate ABC transporter permease PstA [Gordonia mangrovi]